MNTAIQTKAIKTRGGSKIRVTYGAASASFDTQDHSEGARLFCRQFAIPASGFHTANLDSEGIVQVHIPVTESPAPAAETPESAPTAETAKGKAKG